MTTSTAKPADDKPFYLSRSESLALAAPEDDFLHPETNAAIADDSLTETQYLGFSVPEAAIHGIGYLWHHPNLKIVTGGVWAFQGFKRNALACELFDIRAFMSDRALDNDLHAFQLPNGYGARVIEPLKRHAAAYSDPQRRNSLALEYLAVTPPVMYGDGKHFDQPMRVRGELMLRGKRYSVEAYTVRDRSWGKPRAETLMQAPPVAWANGVFGDDFSFACVAFDDARLMPEWGGRFAMPEAALCVGGWVCKEGAVSPIVACHKRTERDPSSLFPLRCEIEFRDALDRRFLIKGSAIAASEWQYQPNMRMAMSAMRWECEGRTAHGEIQEGQWNDFLHAFMH